MIMTPPSSAHPFPVSEASAQLRPAAAVTVPAIGTDEAGFAYVKSPMVGTFYRSAAPGSGPFVEVGDTVAVGDPLCIIEAMKLMNEIESEISGKIVSVLAENGQPVEYGEPLFLIDSI